MILEKEYGIDPGCILYSPIGTDLSLFRYDEEDRIRLRERLGIRLDETVLLYTGKLNYRKNPHLILEAVSMLEGKITAPLRLVFVGAADRDYREQKLNVQFSGKNIGIIYRDAVPVSELYKWYSMADFAVFPQENTLSAMDAQLCSLPVIMTADMTNNERLAEGGLTYEQGSMQDLSAQIYRLISDPALRKSLGERGQAYVKEKYDYRKIVREMERDLGLIE